MLDFHKIWHSRQIEHANYEILIEGDDLHPKLQIWVICSDFYEIWHLEQIEHVNYEYSSWN